MYWHRSQLLFSFFVLLVTYLLHACTKPSELAARGLDPKLYKIREFRVEKLWGCSYCGYPKNTASSSVCMQCGTNQLGEQQILPTATTRGVAVEAWNVKVRVEALDPGQVQHKAGVVNPDAGAGYTESYDAASEGRRFTAYDREAWPFKVRAGGRQSELPTALALAERGFVVTETKPTGAKRAPGGERWGTKRFPAAPTLVEQTGEHLEWLYAAEGVPVWDKVSAELLGDVGVTRGCFFPEKVAWFQEQIHRLQVESMMEDVPSEFATAYPNR